MLVPNYFGWFRILLCYFFSLPFTFWSGIMICVINFKGWTRFALVILNYFKKIYSSSLSVLKIDFLWFFFSCFGFFCEFNFSFRLCTSIQYFFIFKFWHDTTCVFWPPLSVLLVLCFLNIFYGFPPNFIILQFD
jgi:hypothetical protein